MGRSLPCAAVCLALALAFGCANGADLSSPPDGGSAITVGDGQAADVSRDNATPEEMFQTGDTTGSGNPTDVMSTDVPSTECDAGSTVCSGVCTDLDTDPTNCGKCGNVCTGICSMGHCCDVGQQYCSGACIDTTMDDMNCGMCGMTCTSPDSTCCSSLCTDTATDSNNCGMCGMACGSGSTCSASTCTTPCEIPQGSCAHSLCTTGGPLAEGCDPDDCTLAICYEESSFGDPSCCTTAWTSECVADVEALFSSFGCF
jgi:hypothetical protein